MPRYTFDPAQNLQGYHLALESGAHNREHTEDYTVTGTLFRDNFGSYSGAPPELSRSHPVSVPQPLGGHLGGHLLQRQCAAASVGTDCSTLTCDVLPLCREHTRQFLRLDIQESTIEGAGNGLFAHGGPDAHKYRVVFDEDDLIGLYQGEVLDKESYYRRYAEPWCPKPFFAPYVLWLGAYDRVVDALFARGIMSYANDPRDKERVNAYISFPSETGETIEIRAFGPICHGEEIFLEYGKVYWKHFAHAFPGVKPGRVK